MKRVTLLLMVLAVALAMPGCGKSGTTAPPPDEGPAPDDTPAPDASADLVAKAMEGANPEPVVDAVIADGGTLVWRFPAEPATINPLTYRDAYGGMVLDLTADALATRHPDTLEWEGQLAESWESSQDNLTFTFHLRKDAKWHDGVPFTAADVIYSYEILKDPETPAPRIQNYYNDLKEVVALDDYTVEFRWGEPYFKSFEESAGMPIFAKHVFDTGEDFADHPAGRRPVGTGMYRFVEWKTNEYMVLERFEDYYGRKPHIKKIVIRFVPDDNTALLLASSGEVDRIGVRAEDWVNETTKEAFKKRFNRFYYYTPTAGFGYIGWNEKRPFFADARVRSAMTHLVQREKVRQTVLYGLAETVTGPFYRLEPAYDATIEPLAYDPAAAKALLDEAGWVDSDGDGIRDKEIDGEKVDFSFAFTYPSGSKTAEVIGVLLQQDLLAVGVDMNIRQLEWSTFEQQLTNGNFDSVMLGWTGTLEGDPYQIWHSSQQEGGSNYIGYKNAEADEIIEKGRREFDADKRNEMYRRLHRILHEEQPYTFFYTSPALMLMDKRVHNVVIHKLGVDIRDWYIPSDLQTRK